jgi:hypothetical protein
MTYMGFGEICSMEPVVSARKFVVPLFVLIGIAVTAGLIVGLNTGISRSATPSPGDIFEPPFQAAEQGPRVVHASYEPASYTPEPAILAPSDKPVQSWGTVNANLSAPPSVEPARPAATTPAKSAKPEPAKTESSTIAARRVANRAGYVLNDGQIASMKQRLKLTPEQERLWPPVEAALRKIVYVKTAANTGSTARGARTEYVDPNSAEVQHLATVAQPLVRRLNDDQRGEVRSMAFVMGLERLAYAL